MAWYTLSKKIHQEVAQEIERLKKIKPANEEERDWTECKIRRHKETRMFPPMAKAIDGKPRDHIWLAVRKLKAALPSPPGREVESLMIALARDECMVDDDGGRPTIIRAVDDGIVTYLNFGQPKKEK